MEKYKVVINAIAEQQLRDIYEYIYYKLLSPESALRTLNRLTKAIRNLDTFPERYRIYEKEPWKSMGVHVCVVKKYSLFYLLNKETKTVVIVSVLYNGSDFSKRLVKRFNR